MLYFNWNASHEKNYTAIIFMFTSKIQTKNYCTALRPALKVSEQWLKDGVLLLPIPHKFIGTQVLITARILARIVINAPHLHNNIISL